MDMTARFPVTTGASISVRRAARAMAGAWLLLFVLASPPGLGVHARRAVPDDPLHGRESRDEGLAVPW
jgi:hypothetical protein